MPKDKASLFLKISEFGSGWANYPTSEDSVAFWLEDSEVRSRGWTAENFKRLVRIVNKRVSEEDIRKIHEQNNIYVSSGLGEAWDIPAFDAKKRGNRLVYVGFGGPEDYAEPEDIRVWQADGEQDAVHPGYSWEPDAEWAHCSVEELSVKLAEAHPPKVRKLPSKFPSKYGRQAVGELMRKNIRELSIQLGCWERLFG